MVGPTASAKSEVGFELAVRLGACILSVDSMQVYRGLDIATAKATLEMRSRVSHHMLDLVEPEAEFTVSEFQTRARNVIASQETVVIVGGSGLHFRSVVDPLTFEPSATEVRSRLEGLSPEALVGRLLEADPGAAGSVEMANPRRVLRALEIFELTGRTPSERANTPERRAVEGYEPHLAFRAVGLDPGDGLPERARLRVERMWSAGLVGETETYRHRLGRTAAAAIGYSETARYLDGLDDESTAKDSIVTNTVALARRQRTYFRRDPRIHWMEWTEDVSSLLDAAMRQLGL